MENYLRHSIIGEGAYGTVYKVQCLRTAKLFALKYHTHGVEDATVRELSCLAALKGHPHIIEVCDCFLDNGTIAMLMPYVPYTLREVIHDGHGLKCYDDPTPLSFVARFSVQVAEALSYMHGLNIVHRDLTPCNVLLTEDLTVKVADMGLSRQASQRMSPTVVAEPYRAPELFGANNPIEYTCAIDMWSLGVIIADAVEGKPVLAERNICGRTLSTFEIIERTLCPTDRAEASITLSGPGTVMPNVMECQVVKRIVFRLLRFRGNERLLAHELLRDTEWTQLTNVTGGEKEALINRIRRRLV